MDSTEINVRTKYDDPGGIWYDCTECGKQFFIPDFDQDNKETDVFNYCPYCGKKINKVNYNG